ncbi:MAG: transglycosylase SLT domain-containing protein [Armatimonadota bacterium]
MQTFSKEWFETIPRRWKQEDIRRLQEFLRGKGYLPKTHKPTGEYDPTTQRAHQHWYIKERLAPRTGYKAGIAVAEAEGFRQPRDVRIRAAGVALHPETSEKTIATMSPHAGRLVETALKGAQRAASPVLRALRWWQEQVVDRPLAMLKVAVRDPRAALSPVWSGRGRKIQEAFLHPGEYRGVPILPERVLERLSDKGGRVPLPDISLKRGERGRYRITYEPRHIEVSPRKAAVVASELAAGLLYDPLSWIGVGVAPRAAQSVRQSAGLVSAERRAAGLARVQQTAKARQAARQAQELAERIRSLKTTAESSRQLADTVKIKKAELAERLRELLREAERGGRVPGEPWRVQQLAQQLREAAYTELAARQAAKIVTEQARELAGQLRELKTVAKAAPRRAAYGTLRPATPRLHPTLQVAGVPVASLEKPAEALRRAGYGAASSVEPLRRLYNAITVALRAAKPTVQQGLPYGTYRRLGQAVERAFSTIAHEAPGRAVVEAERAIEQYWKGVPEKVRQAVPYLREAETPVERQAVLSQIQPELHPLLEEATENFGRRMDALYGLARQEFGERFPEYIENYVPHLYQNAPKEMRDALRVMTRIERRIAERRLPGASPFLVKEREIEKLHQAEAAGYRPIKDVALLEGYYRHALTRMLEEKRLTDWLEGQGFISAQPRAGWVRGAGFAPWLAGRYVHPDVARAWQATRDVWAASDEAVQAVVNVYKKFVSFGKAAITGLRPGFHFRNFLGNFFLLRMAGVGWRDVAKHVGEAAEALAKKAASKEDSLTREFRQLGLEGQGMFADVAFREGVMEHLKRHLEKVEGGPIKGGVRALLYHILRPIEGGRALGEAVDTLFRLAYYRYLRHRGFAPRDAAQLVRQHLFDYRRLTPLERGLRWTIAPFWAWNRYVLPRLIHTAITQPGAFTFWKHLQDAFARGTGLSPEEQARLEDALPEYLGASLILRVGDDGRLVIFSPGMPAELLYELYKQPYEGVLEAAKRAGGQVFAPLFLTGPRGATRQELMELARKLRNEGRYDLATLVEELGTVADVFMPEVLKVMHAGEPAVHERYFRSPLGAFFMPLAASIDPTLRQGQVLKMMDDLIDKYRKQGRAEGGATDVGAEGWQRQIRMLETLEAVKNDPIKEEVFLRILLHNNTEATGGKEQLNRAIENAADILHDYLAKPSPEAVEELQSVLSPQNVLAYMQETGQEDPAALDVIKWWNALKEENKKPEERRAEKTEEIRQRILYRAQHVTGTEGERRALARDLRAYARLSAQLPVMHGAAGIARAIGVAAVMEGVGEDWLPYLIWLAQRESSFNPSAVGPLHEGQHPVGLMQVKPGTFQTVSEGDLTDIHNPVQNVRAAIRWIRRTYGHPSRIPNIGNWHAFKGY